MKLSLLFLFAFCCLSATAQRNPFASLKFDKVVMYDFGGVEKYSGIIDDKGKLSSTVVKEVQLPAAAIALMNKKIGLRSSYGQVGAMCFEPHLAFVYYLKQKPVAWVEVCFSCNRLASRPELDAQKQGKQGKGKHAYYLLDGMSRSHRLFMGGLVKKYHFSHGPGK